MKTVAVCSRIPQLAQRFARPREHSAEILWKIGQTGTDGEKGGRETMKLALRDALAVTANGGSPRGENQLQ